LHYQPGETQAPKVVARGAGEVAQKIIETGNAYQIPVVEDEWMTKVLYPLQPGDLIPEKLYTPVAKLLAYIYLFKKKTQNLSQQKSTTTEISFEQQRTELLET